MFQQITRCRPTSRRGRSPPPRTRATPAAYVDFVHRTRGVNIPESDIRERYRYDGWDEDITVAATSIGVEHPKYRAVRAPALAIYALADSVAQLEPWQRSDRAHAAGLQELIRGIALVEQRTRTQFRKRGPTALLPRSTAAITGSSSAIATRSSAAVRRFLLN